MFLFTASLRILAILAILATYKSLHFLWTHHARPRLHGDLGLQRYMHATKGKAAWAFVIRADDPVGRALCAQLAARGFNVAMYGSDRLSLDAIRERLRREFPWNRYRVVVERSGLGMDLESGVVDDEVFVARVVEAMGGENMTVLVNNSNSAAQSPGMLSSDTMGSTLATQLTAALIPLLRRNAPSLFINLASIAAPDEVQMPRCASCGAPSSCVEDGVNVVSYRLGDYAAGDEQPSYLKPSPETLASVIPRHAGVERGGGRGQSHAGVVVPYWPHAVLHMKDEALPGWALELGRDLWKGEKTLKW